MTPALETYLSCQAFKLLSHPEVSEKETVSCAPTLSSKVATMMPSSVDKPFSCFFCGTHLCRHQRHVKVRLGRRVIRSPSILSLGGVGLPGSPVLFLCIDIYGWYSGLLVFLFFSLVYGPCCSPSLQISFLSLIPINTSYSQGLSSQTFTGIFDGEICTSYLLYLLSFLPSSVPFSLPLSHDFFFSHVCMYIFCAHIYLCSNVYGHVHLYLHTCVYMCVEHRLMLGVSLYDFSSYIL